MLYDNAQLVSLYSNAFKVIKKNSYKEVVYQTLEFIERELSDSSGGFYSSLDADSEGIEGKYYLWDKKEIENLLGEDSKLFCEYFNVNKAGNWEGGNILFITSEKSELLKKYNLDEKSFDEKIKKSKSILLKERLKRVKPGLDDKILTSWNSLMIKGFVDAYSAFNEEKFLQRADSCGEFILNKMMNEDGKLFRNFKNDKCTISGFLDDYSFTIEAFISLYQITLDEKWIFAAKKLMYYVIKHFHHSESGLFFYKSNLDEPLIARKMELSDNVIPSSNASLATALMKLSKYFYTDNYESLAEKMQLAMKQSVQQNPAFHFQWLIASSLKTFISHEVVLTGESIHEMKVKFLEKYLPNIILAGSNSESSLELLKDRIVPGKNLIYVCENKTCNLPTEDFGTALKQILRN
jgi:uncharacterized protein YyaL (SSP411 family)